MAEKLDNKKEQERANLHQAIWSIADDLRGSVDGWDFKQYILNILFYRYICENITNHINENEHEAGNAEFDYTNISDEMAIEAGIKDEMIKTKGFFILPSALFENVRKNANADEEAMTNLNETIEKAFRAIENSAIGSESESDLKGLFDDFDVNSKKLGNTLKERGKKLLALLNGVANIDFGEQKFDENTIDAFGDAYEYLMKMYASNAGKSGGEFLTPQEVSELLAKLAVFGKSSVNKVYDPACGSGSLLLKFAKILGEKNVKEGFYGQEINITSYNLCRMNMFLHNIGFDKFDIALGDTLLSPMHDDFEPFEAIVSNPPYSIKWEGIDNPLLINNSRFSPAGVLAPKSKADFAFIMHSLSYLATCGTAAIVCFPGIMYRSGAEQKIREYLISQNFVDCIIALPSNLFFGTSIATCIMVLKKNKNEDKTLFIDASNEFVKVTNSNKLSDENIARILEIYGNRKDIEHIARLVDNDEIRANECNLSVSSYITAKDETPQIDIKELNLEISQIVKRQNELRTELDKIIANLEKAV